MGPNKRTTRTLQGTTISPGLAEGPLHLHRDLLGPIDAPEDIEQHSVEEEFLRLDVATTRIADDLLTLATRVEEEIDSRLAEVFGAHQLILGDSSLRDELRTEIAENLVSASSAVAGSGGFNHSLWCSERVAREWRSRQVPS